jgi:hypothetical protein
MENFLSGVQYWPEEQIVTAKLCLLQILPGHSPVCSQLNTSHKTYFCLVALEHVQLIEKLSGLD